ncbi:putative N-acetyltransferase YhbS [Paenibacillus taihuensis]|uniref:Putative N-acetyltransferase YhbS n=1 Tax=Paenibacillus taihuensis TaxID=1156355 RepID=A0A3D9S514_9BACL|nr:N-acetyltransferase [Paenibacillus taihuensis]REE84386.1 putative N-acetyltransferase YhbS [Paenibacillus taihuensis]
MENDPIQILIRMETSDDYAVVREVNYAAFGNRDDEADLVARIRSSAEFIPELSLVADRDGSVVGHLLISKASIVNGSTSHDVLVLAPIAILPAHQKRGVGGLLIREGLNRSRVLGYAAVLLIGHPTYYPRFGFRPASSFGMELKQFTVPDDVFMAYELYDGALKGIAGELQYPAAFF